MIYVRVKDKDKASRLITRDISDFPNISRTGSVIGMRQIYGWPKGGQVRVGSYIYNIGPANVQILKSANLVC